MASDTNAGVGLLGQYFDNADLSGLVLSRVDPAIDFDWATGSPSELIAADTFSVRWSGQVEAIYTEQVHFHIHADEGVRLWVDGQLLINRWDSVPVVDATGSIELIAGRRYDLQLEYFESSLAASVKLEWSSTSQPRVVVPTTRLFPSERGTILKETWNGIEGSSIAALTNHVLYPNSPSSVSALDNLEIVSTSQDHFGDRLRGYLHAPTTGEYTFYIAGDETAELWLSNSSEAIQVQRIASVQSATGPREWTNHASQQSSVLSLVAGQTYFIEVRRKEGTGTDHLAVGWTRPNQTGIEVIAGQYLSPILPTVSLYSISPSTGEGAGGAGRVAFVRSGMSTMNALNVSYSLRGTAINGTDFNTMPGTVTIPAGQSSVSVDIDPIDDGLIEGTEVVILELRDGDGYQVDRISQRTVEVTIHDNSDAPAGGVSAIAGSTLANFTAFGGTFSTVVDPVYGDVIQAAITTTQTNAWNAQLNQAINVPVDRGDLLLLEFYVRSVGETGTTSAIFETSTSPYTKSLEGGLAVNQAWSRVQLPFVSALSYTAGQATIGFYLGAQIQTLQFHGIQLLNYGPSSRLEPAAGIGLQNIGGEFGTMQTVSITGQPFDTAKQIDTITTPANNDSWRLQGLARSISSVAAGDVMQYEFWTRSISGVNPRVGVAFQEAYGDYLTLDYNQISATAEWVKHTFTGTATKDYAIDQLQVTFNVGFEPQSVQLGGFTWRNLTQGILWENLPKRTTLTTYAERSGTDSWRTDADQRIETNRTGNLTVNVVDSNGTPLDGAVVHLRQREQSFRFGTAISGYHSLLSSSTDPEAIQYQSEIKRLFNTVVVENNLKWPDFQNNRQLGIDSANWATSNGLYLRGHNVLWPSFTLMPETVRNQYESLIQSQGATAAADYLRATVRARVTDAASTFAGIAGEWDVVNEPYTNHDVMDILGDDELLEWFRIFRTADPTGKRALNDYDIFARNGLNTAHRANFDYWLGRLTDPDGNNATDDGLLEVIGEQSHYNEGNLTDILVLGQLIQTYGDRYQLPIAITEFDVNTQNQQLQADYLRDYMTMAFSQPAVSQFLHWGFWSKAHWLPDAALYRDDFSIKPNGQAYEDLVFGDWWTIHRGTTRVGQVQSKVFTGEYEVQVSWNGQSLSTTTWVDSSGSTISMTIPQFHVPTDILLSHSAVQENNPANAIVGDLDAIDSDPNSSFVYSLVAGPGGVDNHLFHVLDGSLRASSTFDFETKSIYSVRIRATDETGLATEKSFLIDIKNDLETEGASTDLIVPLYQYPTFEDSQRTQLSGWWREIRLAASAQQPITVVINPNSGPIDPMTTQLSGQYQDYQDALRLLRTNPYVRLVGYLPTGYGQVELAQVSQYLDWYSSGYRDAGGGSLIDGIFLDEVATESGMQTYYRSVRDDIRTRTVLAGNWIVANPGVPIVHPDFITEPIADLFVIYEQIETPNTGITFSDVSLPIQVADGVSFGAILHSVPTPEDMQRVMKLAKSKGYGYVFLTDDLMPNPYDLAPGYWSDQLLEIHRPVILAQDFTVLESSPIGTVVATVDAVDPDPTDSLTYSILDGNIDSAFAISPTGVLTVNQTLDYERRTTYLLTIQVQDSSSMALRDTAFVSIEVGDVNESPVLFSNLNHVSGTVLSILSNSGTWGDPEGDEVSLSASVGAVVKNADGTWDWTYTPTAKQTNQVISVTASDGVNVTSVDFTIDARVAIFQRGLMYLRATGVSAQSSLATDKAPLLPGQASSFANYTNYSRGLNGVVVDVAGLPSSTTDTQMLASLQFAQWNGIAAGGFTSLPVAAIPSVTILGSQGTAGSTRVLIAFPDNTLQNTWLRVTVVANAQTGLTANDVFYFGNVIGEFNAGNTATRLRVNATDTGAVRSNQSTASNSASVTNIYDVNRDGRVNATDTGIVRSNQQTAGIVAPIVAPSLVPPPATLAPLSFDGQPSSKGQASSRVGSDGKGLEWGPVFDNGAGGHQGSRLDSSSQDHAVKRLVYSLSSVWMHATRYLDLPAVNPLFLNAAWMDRTKLTETETDNFFNSYLEEPAGRWDAFKKPFDREQDHVFRYDI